MRLVSGGFDGTSWEGSFTVTDKVGQFGKHALLQNGGQPIPGRQSSWGRKKKLDTTGLFLPQHERLRKRADSSYCIFTTPHNLVLTFSTFGAMDAKWIRNVYTVKLGQMVLHTPWLQKRRQQCLGAKQRPHTKRENSIEWGNRKVWMSADNCSFTICSQIQKKMCRKS